MAAAGFSILVASGDGGTNTKGDSGCQGFSTNFPANSPWVTAVGGTDWDFDKDLENGWSNSGGGFSDYFERPDYQNTAVEAYLASGVELPSQQLWPRGGRAVPDVAAVATRID